MVGTQHARLCNVRLFRCFIADYTIRSVGWDIYPNVAMLRFVVGQLPYPMHITPTWLQGLGKEGAGYNTGIVTLLCLDLGGNLGYPPLSVLVRHSVSPASCSRASSIAASLLDAHVFEDKVPPTLGYYLKTA
jgi:hypothetical protein